MTIPAPRLVRPPRSLGGRLTVPGDKSISHRAVILNSVARGTARVSNFLPAADCLSTVACLRRLGVSIRAEDERGHTLLVEGRGAGGLREPEDVLDAGNSGTTMRLLAGLLAGQPFLSILTGDDSLRSRPMGRVIAPLQAMGASVQGRARDTLAPLCLRGGQLRGIEHVLPVASAQVKSALLLAGLYADGPTRVVSPAASRDHTERLLTAMGARVHVDGATVVLSPPDGELAAVEVRVPGDLSSAAFWLVAAAVHPRARLEVEGVGMNPSRTGVLEVLEAMGAPLERRGERLEAAEPVADLAAASGRLQATEIAGDLIPRVIDEIPILAVAALAAEGATVIRDAAELRVKETDRIATTAGELRKLGACIEELPDGMVIQGGRRLSGARVDSHGDHRLAMALGVAGLLAEGETIVEGAEAVEVSYPGFWDDLERLTGRADQDAE